MLDVSLLSFLGQTAIMKSGIAVLLKKYNFVLAAVLVEIGAVVAVVTALLLTFSTSQSSAGRDVAAIETGQRGQPQQQRYDLVRFTRTTSPTTINPTPLPPTTTATPISPTPVPIALTTAAPFVPPPAPTGDDLTAYEYEFNGAPVGVYVKVTELSNLPSGQATSVAVTGEYITDSPRLLSGWPVKGRITQGFGCSPYYTGIPGVGCQDIQPWFHDGIDIAAPEGTPVQAMINGVVTFAGPDGEGPACGDYRGYGLGVIVDSQDGWQALYAHLSGINVSEGQAVTPETIIGAVGQTGCVSGAHLHFGLRRNGELVNPKEFMMGLE
jgi:murein DD-endopeptidase MepM/ murein hydrolase activator NlpD